MVMQSAANVDVIVLGFNASLSVCLTGHTFPYHNSVCVLCLTLSYKMLFDICYVRCKCVMVNDCQCFRHVLVRLNRILCRRVRTWYL